MALTQISTNGIKNNTITGTDLATNVDLVDNQKLRIGTGNDLEIYHSGTNSIIDNINTSASLHIKSPHQLKIKTGQFVLKNTADTENLIYAAENDKVALYHDNSAKLETTSTGVTVTGTLTADTVRVLDNEAIGVGVSTDLQMYHDASGSVYGTSGASYIKVQGTHDNIFDIFTASATGKISLKSSNLAETMLSATGNGAVELYFNNSKKFETTSTGATITGNFLPDVTDGRNLGSSSKKWASAHLKYNLYMADDAVARFGDSDDLQIYHDGSHSYIKDAGTGQLRVLSNQFRVHNAADTETMIAAFQEGAVKLTYDNSTKLETTSTGVTISGKTTINDDLLAPDNAVLRLGNASGGDLQIYHNGSASYISDQGTGELILKSNSISFTNAAENEYLARFFQDSAVELYFNGSKKFHTKNGGVYITGDIETSGDFYMLDNEKIRIGNSQDLELYHDSISSVIKNLTNDLYVQSIADVKIRTNDSELAVDCTVNGSVALYYDGSKKLETTSLGVNADYYTGTDNAQLRLGDSGDLQIYHTGSNSYIDAGSGTGALIFKSSTYSFRNAADNEQIAMFNENGAVNLYYDNGKKFETRSDGVKLSQGHFYADDHSRIKLGDGEDLQIYHDGTHSRYVNSTGLLLLQGSDIRLANAAGTETLIKAVQNGSVELYYDDSIRIRTQSYGIEYHNQQHKFIHSNSGGVGAYLSLFNTGTAAGGKTGIVFGIGNSNAILDGTDYGEGQIKCFTDSGYYGNLEFNLHVGANRSWMKIVGNGAAYNGAGAGTEGMRGGVAFGCAGIAIDRSWTGQPGIHVFNANSEGDTDQGTFRFHGWNRSYASYPNNSGSDFSVNLVADGTGLSSDERRKTGIATITNALDTITKMRGVSFQFVNRELDPQTHMSMDNGKKLGFIAQEVIPLLPQLILDSGEKNVPLANGWCDRYSMDYSGVTAVLVEAIKELAAKVASLESKITE